MINILIITCFVAFAALPLLARFTGASALRQMSNHVAVLFRKIVNAAFSIATVCGLCIALVMMFTLVTRNIFGVNFIFVQESALYLFAGMFLLGSGGILLTDGHVRVDVLYSQWSQKRRAHVDIVGYYLFLFPVCALILIAAMPYVAQSWASFERSAEPSGIHAVFLLKSLIPAFGILVAMAGFTRVDTLLNGRDDA